MTCKNCGCESHCGMSCTSCWECPDCDCKECSKDEPLNITLTEADVRD